MPESGAAEADGMTELVAAYPPYCDCDRCRRISQLLILIWEKECALTPAHASFHAAINMMRVAGGVAGGAARPGAETRLMDGLVNVFRSRFEDGVRFQAEHDAREVVKS